MCESGLHTPLTFSHVYMIQFVCVCTIDTKTQMHDVISKPMETRVLSQTQGPVSIINVWV